MKLLHPVFSPLALCLLLIASSATSDVNARSASVNGTGPAAMSDVQDRDFDADDELDAADDEDMPLDADGNYDPAEYVRRKLANQPAARGSGGPSLACMISGRVTIAGHTEDVRDCMYSGGRYSKTEFERACEGLANGLASTGNAPARIDYMPRCPAPSQGSCRNFLNSGMDAHYYQRTDTTPLPASCAGAGGTWVPAS